MNPSERADIDWLAFCYVAGEMSAEETDEFERRLADDQPAREAVAQAVELCQAVASVSRESQSAEAPAAGPAAAARRTRRHWELLAGWTALAAATAFFAFAAGLNLKIIDEPVSVTTTDAAQAARLLDVWTRSRDVLQDSVALSGGESAFGESTLAAGEPQDNGDSQELDVDEEILVPGWMLTAVGSTLVPDSPEPQPGTEEN